MKVCSNVSWLCCECTECALNNRSAAVVVNYNSQIAGFESIDVKVSDSRCV